MPKREDRRRLALAVEEVAVAAVRREIIQIQPFARERQRGVEHAVGLGETAVVLEQGLVEHLEAIARLQLALKVDVEAEDPDHLDQHRHGQSGVLGGGGEVVVDPAFRVDRHTQ
jgi:hypothetical protein